MPIEVRIEFSDEFLAAVKKLRKRYRHIEDDLRPLISQLKRGEHPGDLLQGTTFEGTTYQVYKERLPNRDAQRGKSGGYRAIYYLQSQALTIMVTIYSKSDQADISLEEIAGILRGVLEQKAASPDEAPADQEIPPTE
jgi:mRNA-degrading endonuclease RelE of RelBE toxin-antitoxin system